MVIGLGIFVTCHVAVSIRTRTHSRKLKRYILSIYILRGEFKIWKLCKTIFLIAWRLIIIYRYQRARIFEKCLCVFCTVRTFAGLLPHGGVLNRLLNPNEKWKLELHADLPSMDARVMLWKSLESDRNCHRECCGLRKAIKATLYPNSTNLYSCCLYPLLACDIERFTLHVWKVTTVRFIVFCASTRAGSIFCTWKHCNKYRSFDVWASNYWLLLI